MEKIVADLDFHGQQHKRASAEIVEEYLANSLTTARRQGARLLELRTATTLARVLAEKNERHKPAGPDLRLVHRRLRHARSENGEGPTGRVGVSRWLAWQKPGANVFPGRPDLHWHNQEWLFRVQPTRSVATARMTAFGASCSLPFAPARVP
jgi:hypothetical protein